jgi:hypothetical protein
VFGMAEHPLSARSREDETHLMVLGSFITASRTHPPGPTMMSEAARARSGTTIRVFETLELA